MPNFGMLPQTATLVGLQTITTNSTTTSNLSLPSASCYRLIFQVGAATGTSPTLQFFVSTSFDNGATYNEILSTAQITTSGLGQQLLIRPYMNPGDVATNAATALLGTANLGTSAVVNNGPLNPAFIKISWVVGGTTPSFANTQVQYAALPQDMSD